MSVVVNVEVNVQDNVDGKIPSVIDVFIEAVPLLSFAEKLSIVIILDLLSSSRGK